MIVMKFGGTSVQDTEAMERVIAIIKSRLGHHPIVVVSAMAQITNTLIHCAQLAREGKEKEALKLVQDVLAKRHHETIDQLIKDASRKDLLHTAVEKYLDEIRTLVRGLAILGELSPRSLDAIASYGEQFSSRILAAAMQEHGLKAELVDSRRLIITDENYTKAAPLINDSTNRMKEILLPLLDREILPVTQGFVGSTRNGATTTLGRDGSDYSATIIGASLDAEVIEIWTDVDGILTADPKLVPHARVLETVTFEEASELAYFGAKILHPSTLLPAVEKRIPVHVYNTTRPTGGGTHILSDEVKERQRGSVNSIAYKKGITVINVYSARMLQAHGFLKSIFEVFDRFETSVDLVATSEVNVSLTIDDQHHLQAIVSELKKFSTVTVEHSKAIICLVGAGMRYTPGISARTFGAIRDMNIVMISQGASEVNLSFIVDEEDVQVVIQKLHREFFE
jgi:aspartate kinase